MNYKIICFLMLSVGALTASCNSWLDISPKTEVKVDENFSNEAGFKDALTGVYLLMTAETLYGRDLSCGMVEVLGKQYSGVSSSMNDYYYLSEYNYTEQKSIDKIDAVWSGMYNTITNLNVLIEQVDRASPSLFTANNQSVIRGEAYGLRAFIHFDLLRLFGASPSVEGAGASLSIPYVTKYSKDVTPYSTIDKVIELVLSDLAVAERELESDPIYEAVVAGEIDESYMRNRELKFNYYAVKLLQARVYLYIKDYENAIKAAQVVIDQRTFTWTPTSEITTTTVEKRNVLMGQELIFSLNVSAMLDIYTAWFSTSAGLPKYAFHWDEQFEKSMSGYSSDYRYLYLSQESVTGDRYGIKLLQPELAGNSIYSRRMPLMRFTEAYYIAAECMLHSSDIDAAMPYLSAVRTKRNITATLDATMSRDSFQNEIFKEYAKEFMYEGQLFYYYKRLNLPAIRYGYSFTSDKYVLPLPKDETANR